MLLPVLLVPLSFITSVHFNLHQNKPITGRCCPLSPQLPVKPLLHPIVRVYTRKCAANIVEKYEHGLIVG